MNSSYHDGKSKPTIDSHDESGRWHSTGVSVQKVTSMGRRWQIRPGLCMGDVVGPLYDHPLKVFMWLQSGTQLDPKNKQGSTPGHKICDPKDLPVEVGCNHSGSGCCCDGLIVGILKRAAACEAGVALER